MSQKQTRWNFFIPTELLAEVKTMADEHGVSSAEIVRVACTKYLAAVKRARETGDAAKRG